MKIGKREKIWLIAVLFFWVFYNFPGFPAYGDETGCIVHGIISFVGTVLSVFVGCRLVEKEYPLVENPSEDPEEEVTESQS